MALVYTLVGFWLVPALIKDQLPKIGQDHLARPLAVGEVRFNPYTLRLEASELSLGEADGSPLASLGHLVVELQWRSLVRRAWSFAEIRLTEPSVALAIAADGRFNIAELLASIQRSPPQPDEESSLPRVIVERFALVAGSVSVDDRRVGYATRITPIDFALNNFSTLPDQGGDYVFGAEAERGAKLGWHGELALNPLHGSGELTVDDASLPELSGYLKGLTTAAISAGKLSLAIPYRFSYADGKLDARIEGARLGLRDLALTRDGAGEPFARLASFEASDIALDLASRLANIGALRLSGGKLAVRRDADGIIDLTRLMVQRPVTGAGDQGGSRPAPPPAPVAPAQAHAPAPAVAQDDAVPAPAWKVALKKLELDQFALSLADETVTPAFNASVDQVRLGLRADAELLDSGTRLDVGDAEFSLADLVITSGAQTPFKLARLGFSGGKLDLAARSASVERVFASGGELQLIRAGNGSLEFVEMLPRAARADPKPAAKPAEAESAAWAAQIAKVELAKFAASVEDRATGVKAGVRDFDLDLSSVSTDLSKPVRFSASLAVAEGGKFAASGQVVPGSGSLRSEVALSDLALAPLQPLLGQHIKLRIAGGSVSAKGRLSAGAGNKRSPGLQYSGSFDVAGLELVETDGEPFAKWRNVGATRLTATLAPNRLEIPELRVTEPSAKLIINDDRSLNAARLLVASADTGIPSSADANPSSGAPPGAPVSGSAPASDGAPVSRSVSAQGGETAAPGPDSFPVRIPRVLFENAKLDFTDLSLRPQFAAKIYELNGVINGLSSDRQARSQAELDGRVDEFGLVRIRGELNPFAPRDNTDIGVVFKNVDLVSASPYAMKFAGYRIAAGKISLDLQYKVRSSQLEGANQIVIDKLTLGERVDSPDALNIPLELAIAILTDNDGRIDLGLPISGDMNNPQFSYGAIVWKAIGNVLTKIVTAPFRALGALLGISGESLESIDFDAGSDRLLPPEREKLAKVAQILAKRSQLKLAVAGGYAEAADGAALRKAALRHEVALRAGRQLAPGEEAGPIDLEDAGVHKALRTLYAERRGSEALAGLEKEALRAAAAAAAGKQATEAAGKRTTEAAGKPATEAAGKPATKPVVGRAFYDDLRQRLEKDQPLPAEALTALGGGRATNVVAALAAGGVDSTRLKVAAPVALETATGATIKLKLELGNR